jgi:outer membrane murein-binding lipoprotein Lpp
MCSATTASRHSTGENRASRDDHKEETMLKAKSLKIGLAGAAALMLSACVSPDEVASLDNRVGELESRVNAAEARASQMEAAANQCTAACQEVEARASRMMQQSMTK